jgi:IS30 family transposase
MVHFSPEERAEIWERLASGQSVRSVAIGLGRYPSAVRQLVQRTGGISPLVVKSRGPRFLSIFEREEISRGLLMGSSIRFIAQGLKRCPSTISREIQRNGGSGDYYGLRAEKSAAMRAARPISAKLATHPAPAGRGGSKIGTLDGLPSRSHPWLAMTYPDNRQMHVSHERIYMSLFVQGRGALGRQLHKSLRTGRALRRRGGSQPYEGQGHISDMVLISARPGQIEDRAILRSLGR